MSLIERLEAAEVGSRELDAEMFEVFTPVSLDEAIETHRLTQSLDSALALAERVLPDETFWEISHPSIINGKRQYHAEVFPLTATVDLTTFYGFARTPALALCIAILKAKETK